MVILKVYSEPQSWCVIPLRLNYGTFIFKQESGSVIPTQDITEDQPTYDFIVNTTGCANSSDTLACLRTVPSQVLLDAINQTPSSFSYLRDSYGPTNDGVFLETNAQDLLAQGAFTKVKMILHHAP
jgi:acetylcholinesterase